MAILNDNTIFWNVPATGFAIALNNNQSTVMLRPSGTLASGGITLPTAPVEGHIVTIISSQIVSSFTLSSGAYIDSTPTALAANVPIKYVYTTNINIGTGWYKLQ
jgi:hypothetical protein